jgi:hypothetical protein
MNRIQIITMGASGDKLVSIRGTIGEAALRFFADRLLGGPADGFIAELHDKGEALRMFDGWGEMCMIEAKADGPILAHESHYTMTKEDFANVLKQAEIKVPQAESV